VKFLDGIRRTCGNQPVRLLIYGKPGSGKTSTAACAKNPLFLMSPGETGLLTLMSSGILKDIPYATFQSAGKEVPHPTNWNDMLSLLGELASDDHDYKTIVVDAISGLDTLCMEHVKRRDYDGEEKKFMAYNKGYDSMVNEWNGFLAALDNIRLSRGVNVILIGHSVVKAAKNPMGEDYDRYEVPLRTDKIWNPTERWVDAILFFGEALDLKEDGARNKASSATRVIFTGSNPTNMSKNRFGLPPVIRAGVDHRATWNAIGSAIAEAVKKNSAKHP
jgi:hypothetical protein